MTSLESSVETELTLRDIGRSIRRRLVPILAVTALLTITAYVISLFSTRRYEATSTIQVQRESSDGLDLNSLVGGTQATSDALDSDVALQTQALILQSDTLAMRTVKKLKLQDTVDFRLKASQPKPAMDNLDAPSRQAGLLGTFHKNLTVTPVPGTHLIKVSYLNPDPKLAATVVNEVVQELIDENFETRFKATQSASQELGKQLADLREQSEKLQAQVAVMQRDSGIYSIGTTDANGKQQAYSAVLEQFQRSASTLSDAAESRIIKQGVYQAANAGDAELISSLSGNGNNAGSLNALSSLQGLRAQQATQQALLDQLKVKFGPGYPRVAELQANIAALNSAIKQETDRIAKRAESDFRVADRTFNNAKQAYDAQKSKADDLNDKAIRYMITRQEADDSRSLYEDLLKRLKEAGILQGLRSSTITVVDTGLIPAGPKKPNTRNYLAAGLLGGLFLGCATALLADLMDDSLQDATGIERLGLPLLAILPALGRRGKRQDVLGNAHSEYGDAIRNLRAELVRANGGAAPGAILIASTAPTRRKDTVAHDLAVCFAQQRRRVLLVEADMRQHALTNGSTPSRQEGLSVLLSNDATPGTIVAHSKLPYLSVLPSGPMPPNASELLESERMEMLVRGWREMYDVVVIDGPPILPTADARILAELADVTIQVVQGGFTTKTSLRRATAIVNLYAKHNAGVVLDGATGDANVVDRYYGYRLSTGQTRKELA